MKKILALILVLAMALTMVACGSKDNNNDEVNNDANIENNENVENNEQEDDVPPEEDEEAPAESVDPLTLLTTVWGTYGEDEIFSIAGGDYDTMTMDAPGTFTHTNTEYLDSMLGVPADIAGNINAAASMMHMMNANTFTCGAFDLVDGSDVAAFAEALKNNILVRQWMCGFPDTLIIIQVNDTVVSAFGNAEIIENFKNKVSASYENAVLLAEESLV